MKPNLLLVLLVIALGIIAFDHLGKPRIAYAQKINPTYHTGTVYIDRVRVDTYAETKHVAVKVLGFSCLPISSTDPNAKADCFILSGDR